MSGSHVGSGRGGRGRGRNTGGRSVATARPSSAEIDEPTVENEHASSYSSIMKKTCLLEGAWQGLMPWDMVRDAQLCLPVLFRRSRS